MATVDSQPEVLVLGEHPATYLAAALVRLKSKIRVLHATLPDESVPDRLVLLNPRLFELHKVLETVRRRIEMTAVYGVRFLADDPPTCSEYHTRAAVGYVAAYKDVRAAMMRLAQDQGVHFITPRSVHIHGLDELGLSVALGKTRIHPKALMLGGILSLDQQKLLGLPESWGPDVVHRYTFIKLKGKGWVAADRRPTMAMSLDLKGLLHWAWMLPGPDCVQLAVEQPIETIQQARPEELLRHWADVLVRHGVLKAGNIPLGSAQSMDLPLAGALAHEGLANRTVLIGPAGGFYTACAEDIYPNCWSAIYAADAVRKALKETHLQDALQPYRHKWRTTLGNYLRGPQQNLRFLLPLVYRNQVMTNRLAEAILTGKSVIR